MLFITVAMRIRHHYDLVGEATALHPHAVAAPPHEIAPHPGGATAQEPRVARDMDGGQTDSETEDNPEAIHNLTLVPVAALDLPSMRALAASYVHSDLFLACAPAMLDDLERFASV